MATYRYILPLLAVFASHAPAAAQKPSLTMPVQCDIGKTCFVQQYVDVDPGPGFKDYKCGVSSSNGHGGVDIRVASVRDAKSAIPVLAVAPGVVAGIRDGIADRLVRNVKEREAIANRACGNGVIVDHGHGWVTQYCHLKKGSVRVAKGTKVERGQAIGSMGYSGNAPFPHVHLEVRNKGKLFDPFTGRAPDGTCGADDTQTLWREDVFAMLDYRTGEVLRVGFTNDRTSAGKLVRGTPDLPQLSRQTPALVAYAWLMNLKKGDVLRIWLDGPKGNLTKHAISPLRRDMAEYTVYTGRKKPKKGWPAGAYKVRFELDRKGKVINKGSRQLGFK